MEYLLKGVNVSGEICPMSAGGSCYGVHCDCNNQCTIQTCDDNCPGRCTANCSNLFVCGWGQIGYGQT